ncbi:GlsB/YeaQ/YmgE family stress response membrane protein [Chitinophaga oryzae]|uniref:GlsB/YeaQ/YmgE family stress response membrane protein n=1 Tax=Chitinophaga oryzae TaxID=2725414 RepID=A0AAE7DAY5_9BACT|nr:GlsB/YeaQ/YmgE family stress response membrane protein [Chitinophaga oryzae]
MWTIIIGGIAGWLAGKIMRGDGYGILIDIILGVVGGWIFGKLGLHIGGSLIGSLVVALIGSIILIWLVRLIKR